MFAGDLDKLLYVIVQYLRPYLPRGISELLSWLSAVVADDKI